MQSWKRLLFVFVGAVCVIGGRPAGAQPQTFQTYRCEDGTEFIAAFYSGDKRAHLQLDGKAVALSKRVSLSGARYSRGDITLRVARTGVTLQRGKETTACTVKKP